MRYALARVVMLLSVALALANAQCFTRCLVQPVEHAAPPCHSHGKVQAPGPQHDLRPSPELTVTAGSLAFGPVSEVAVDAGASASLADVAEFHPPPRDIAIARLPLRI